MKQKAVKILLFLIIAFILINLLVPVPHFTHNLDATGGFFNTRFSSAVFTLRTSHIHYESRDSNPDPFSDALSWLSPPPFPVDSSKEENTFSFLRDFRRHIFANIGHHFYGSKYRILTASIFYSE